MNKIILIIISLIIISCGNKEETSSNEPIEFWHFWSEPNQKVVLDSIINEFTNSTGIAVNTTELSWNDGKTKLLAAFNSQTAPDVLELGSDWVAQFSSSGVLEELDSNLSKYIPWSTEPCYWDKKVYAKPWIVDSRVIFYNKDLLSKFGFDSPGETFQEMFTRASIIGSDRETKHYGFGVNGPDPNRLYKKALIFIWSRGGDIFKDGKLVLDCLEKIC
jgi:multiple sugar transport system substrate-binding protein